PRAHPGQTNTNRQTTTSRTTASTTVTPIATTLIAAASRRSYRLPAQHRRAAVEERRHHLAGQPVPGVRGVAAPGREPVGLDLPGRVQVVQHQVRGLPDRDR